jgi:ubiquinone/menaquinone biosynthesis C-methylase UbiE
MRIAVVQSPFADMTRGIDALTSLTLKHVRERWWNDAFAEFLEQALKPRPGKRILDVGCGVGTAEISLARLQISQLRLFGVDHLFDRVREALSRVRGINARAGFAAADAGHLPFVDGAFDCTFCVAVLQHLRDVPLALSELARVTRPGGLILAVEPDNAGRYWYSSIPSGMEAFEVGRRFLTALALARGESPPTGIGPALPGLFSAAGITPLSVDLFPVSASHVGSPPAAVWKVRAEAIEAAIAHAPNDSLRRLGSDFAAAVSRYSKDATAAGKSFVEIQNAMLFASVGQRPDSA